MERNQVTASAKAVYFNPSKVFEYCQAGTLAKSQARIMGYRQAVDLHFSVANFG